MEKAPTLWKPCMYLCFYLKVSVAIIFFLFFQSGLGELLNAKNMYDSNYHSLALDLRPVCRVTIITSNIFLCSLIWFCLVLQDNKCQESSLELKLSLSLVSEPTVLHGNTYHGINADWSFKSIYGAHLFSSCPRAQLSKVYIDITSNLVSTATFHSKQIPYLEEPNPPPPKKQTNEYYKIKQGILYLFTLIDKQHTLEIETRADCRFHQSTRR